MARDKSHRLVRGSARFYESLVGLYPESFREDYAREMSLAFRDLLREEHSRRGVVGLLLAWLNELPSLVAGMLSERSVTVARTVAGARKLVNLKLLMVVNALILILFGAALSVRALDLLVAYGFIADFRVPGTEAPDAAWMTVLPVKLMTQTLGMALAGAGFIIWAATRATDSNARTALTLTLAVAHGLMALAFWGNLIQYQSVLGWVSLWVSVAFTLAYAGFFLAAVYASGQEDGWRDTRSAGVRE